MSDDISFCFDAYDIPCDKHDCERHPANIQDRTIPHSYMNFYGSDSCELTRKQMTIQEAIKTLEPILFFDKDKDEALHIAIETLEQPTADVVEVVRCKDCKHYKFGSDETRYCFMNDSDHLWQDDDYCSYAEGVEDEQVY